MQAMTVLEAGGFDVVLVETVGVGQSEITVAGMVDTFLLRIFATVTSSRASRRASSTAVHVIAVNKADGDREQEAEASAKDLAGALRMVYAGPPCRPCSPVPRSRGVASTPSGSGVIRHREFMGRNGLHDKRAQQQLDFTWALVRDELDQRLRTPDDRPHQDG